MMPSSESGTWYHRYLQGRRPHVLSKTYDYLTKYLVPYGKWDQ